jgi:hypothetical protein
MWNLCLIRGLELSSVSISEGNSPYRVNQSFLQDISGHSIYRYFGNCRSVVIPSFVTVLCKASFAWCKSLTRVEFENHSQLQHIGELAFSESGLTRICIPLSLTEEHKTAFLNCLSETTVIFQSRSKDELTTKSHRKSPGHILAHHNSSEFAVFGIQTLGEWRDQLTEMLSVRHDDREPELGAYSSDDSWDGRGSGLTWRVWRGYLGF